MVRNLTIHVADSDVANGTCDDSSPVEAAISFDTLGLPSRVPGLAVTNVVVTADFDKGAQFCNAIEYVGDRTQASPFFPGSVRDSKIGLNSYSNFGISVTNINTRDSNTAGEGGNVAIVGNRVYSSSGCVGIQVGPWVERAEIEFNDIDVGCDGSGGVGISIDTTGVAGGSGTEEFKMPLPANLVGNTVDVRGSATVGVSIVDSAIGKNEGNAIIGDDGEDPYLCDNSGTVSFPTKGKKKNTFSVGTTTTIITTGVGCSDS